MRILIVALVLVLSAAAYGQVVNPRITTDSSIDCSSAQSVVSQILKPDMTDEQKAVTCWKFMLDHFYHWYQQREPDVTGDVRDFAKMINSYGFAPCFVNAPVVTALWEAAGYETRCWTITGHTVPEVKYGGAWHLLDSDARAWHRKPDGQIASVEELAMSVVNDKTPDKSNNLFTNPKEKSDPYYPFGAPDKAVSPLDPWGPPSRMLDLYGSTRDNYRFNRRAVMGHPMYVTLRAGETLTLNRANVGKFYNAAYPKEKLDPGPIDISKTVTYGNGTLAWRPSLANGAEKDVLWTGSSNVKFENGRIAPDKAGAPAVAVFRVWCPWVLVEAKASIVSFQDGDAKCEVSTDDGAVWADLPAPGWIVEKTGIGAATLDLTAQAAGHYHYLLRVTTAKGGIVLSGFNNLFQVAPLSLPRVKPGKNTVTVFRGPDEGAVSLTLADVRLRKDRYVVESDGLDPKNVTPAGQDGKPAFAVYKLSAPAELVALSLGGMVTMDPGKDQRIVVSYSLDAGKNWTEVWRIADNANRDNSSFEMDKRVELKDCTAKEALVRFDMVRRTKYFGVNSIRLYAFYRQPQPAAAKLTVDFAWEEKQGDKWTEKKQSVVVDKFPFSFDIDCAGDAARLARIVLHAVE